MPVRLNLRSRMRRLRLAKMTLAALIIALALFTALAVSGRVLFTSHAFHPSPGINAAQSPPSGLLGQAQIVHFTLYDAGIFPKEAYVSPGLVAIYINDLSGGSQGLVVVSETNQNLGQITRAQGSWRGSGRIPLGRGRYQVYDASRPAHRATLIVQP